MKTQASVCLASLGSCSVRSNSFGDEILDNVIPYLVSGPLETSKWQSMEVGNWADRCTIGAVRRYQEVREQPQLPLADFLGCPEQLRRYRDRGLHVFCRFVGWMRTRLGSEERLSLPSTVVAWFSLPSTLCVVVAPLHLPSPSFSCLGCVRGSGTLRCQR